MPNHKSKFLIDMGNAAHEQRKQHKKAKQQMKRNRDARPPRRRDWIGLAEIDPDDVDEGIHFERIMPRDETDRRKAIIKVAYTAPAEEETPVVEAKRRFAPTPTPKPATVAPDEAEEQIGLVTEISTGLCRVHLDGHTLICPLRGALTAAETGYSNIIAVGDRVILGDDGQGKGVIEQILPRRNQLARIDTYHTHLQNVIAANIDQVLVVASWLEPNLWPELVDRYLITAERNQITPVICINKVDLAENRRELESVAAVYRELDYAVLLTSIVSEEGIAELRELLTGSVTVLAGLSGVGKSSLLTAVEPSFQLRVGAVSEYSLQGQHTTTQVNMLPFGADGYVIDTPGIREFGLGGLHKPDVVRFYPDLAAVAGECRFANCAHLSEPDCAVRAQVEAGTISAMRYDSYCKIRCALPD